MINSIVIKAVRACNLRCPYCYYINDQTTDYGKVISAETIRALYRSVAAYLEAEKEMAGEFSFIWHGGEPLLMGRKRFQNFLDLQAEYFAPGQVHNSIQTNGVLIDQQWVEFLKRNKVGAGVSLDSTPQAHDKNRITRSGAGTYARVLEAIRCFRDNGVSVATLSVVDGAFKGSEAINNIASLKIPACDFLLPMSNNALQNSNGLTLYQEYTDFRRVGEFLADAFRSWTGGLQHQLTVRLFLSLLGNAFGFAGQYLPTGSTDLAQVVVLETNGEFCLDPDFWHIDRYGFGKHYRLPFNVHDKDFALQGVERSIAAFAQSHDLQGLPDDCQNCKVRSLCRGAHPASRFGVDGSFNHRSAWCEAMHALCDAVLQYIIERGYTDRLYDHDLRDHIARQAQPEPLACASS